MEQKAMLRSYRLLAKNTQNRLNKFDWKPFHEEVYGKRLKPDSSIEAPRRAHTFVPERESDEVAKRPMMVLPVVDRTDLKVADEVEKEYSIVGPQPRQVKLWNGEAVGFGGRKTATATVRVKPAVGGSGTGVLAINALSINTYFPLYTMREPILEPLLVTETLCDVDCHVTVRGGGKTAQAGAVRLALGRALQNLDPAYRWALKLAGCLERDARIVERKKTGKPKARRSKQWSKR